MNLINPDPITPQQADLTVTRRDMVYPTLNAPPIMSLLKLKKRRRVRSGASRAVHSQISSFCLPRPSFAMDNVTGVRLLICVLRVNS